MDIDSMLNFEKRTGVKNADIDDFLKKANAVEEAIRGMRDGTVDPDTIKIEGIDTDAEIAEKALKKAQRLAEIKAKNDALVLERKREEKKRWWDGVEVMVPLKTGNASVTIEQSEEDADAHSFHQLRYSSNYSRWNEWTPSDPATKLETAERIGLEDKKRNEEFENNNKEFCDKYLNDMSEREKEKNKKIRGADSNRLRGNNYFKNKKFEDALKCYMEALKDQPFDAKILINIAQVHIKWENSDDALEFLARVLRVDSTHVKALSRMAHVLRSLHQATEALEYAKKALAADPTSSDIQRQVVELELAVKTKKDEEGINALKAKACGGLGEGDKAALERTLRASHAAGGDTATAMEQLEQALKMPMLANGFQLIDDFVAGNVSTDTVENSSDLVSKCIQLLTADDNMRVYFRTSGALLIALTKLRELGAVLTTETIAQQGDRRDIVSDACKYVQLLRTSVVGETANMSAITVSASDSIVYLVSLLQVDYTLSVEVLELINLLFEESHSTSLNVLLNYKSVLVKISDYLHSATISGPLQQNKKVLSACLHCGLQFVRSYLFNVVVKSPKFTFPLSTSSGAALVENLAISLQVLMCADVSAANVVETNLEALLGCSQYSILRGAFCNSVRSINLPMEVPCPTALHVIALLSTEKYRRPAYLPLCLGILMNLCVADDEATQAAMRDKIVQSGCLELVVDIVTMAPDKRATLDTLVLARAAGLLARLTASPLAAETVKNPVLYGKLCRRLAENISLSNREEKWVADECGYLVRVIATLPNVPQQCLDVAFNEKLVDSILSVFPIPRLEMGHITPASVVLPPMVPISAILVGNAARCLVPLADDAKNSAILFTNAGKQGVEKLICALANCTDMRVRKNIAILLAKGAKVPEVRAKIERFRGMQMLVELQKSL